MTVEELIQHLKHYPQDYDVEIVATTEEFYKTPFPLCKVVLVMEKINGVKDGR